MESRAAHLRDVLIIAYFYPPHKGIGGKRIFRWARLLPRFGLRPVVLTTPLPPQGDLDPGQPWEAPGVEVVRGYVPDFVWRAYHGAEGSEYHPGPLARVLSSAGRLFGTPIDDKLWSVPFALRRARALLRERSFSAILTTSSPYSTHLVGLLLSQEAKIPLVADFRDPWSFNFLSAGRAPLLRALEQRVERRVMQQAARVLFAARATQRRYEELYPELSGRALTLYSGFDPEPLPQEAGRWPLSRRPKVTLVHFGRFYGVRRLGVVLDALAKLKRAYPLGPDDLGLLILGEVNREDQERARALGVDDLLHILPMLPYEEGLSLLKGADILLLCDYAKEPYFVPGKLFDYLRVKRPVLALSANEELHALVQGRGMGRALWPEEAEALSGLLERSLREGAETALSFAPKDLAFLSAESSARTLAEIFREICPEVPPSRAH